MRKYFIFIFIIFSTTIYSQSFFIGISEEYANTKIFDDNGGFSILNLRPLNSFNFGYNINGYISIETGLTNDIRYDYINYNWKLHDVYRHTNQLRYLRIPISAKFYISDNVRFYGSLGAFSSILYKSDYKTIDTNVVYNNSINPYSVRTVKGFDKLFWGISYGLGFEQRLSNNIDFGIELNYINCFDKLKVNNKEFNPDLVSGKVNLRYNIPNFRGNKINYDTILNRFPKSTVFIDLLGEAYMLYSINYSRTIKQFSNSCYSFRIGLGYLPKKDGWKSVIGIPISFDITKGRNRNFLEIGLGFTYNRGMGQVADGNMVNGVSNVDYASTLYKTFRIGYKRMYNNVFIKVGLLSFYRLHDFRITTQSEEFFIFPGLSIGYNIY